MVKVKTDHPKPEGTPQNPPEPTVIPSKTTPAVVQRPSSSPQDYGFEGFNGLSSSNLYSDWNPSNSFLEDIMSDLREGESSGLPAYGRPSVIIGGKSGHPSTAGQASPLPTTFEGKYRPSNYRPERMSTWGWLCGSSPVKEYPQTATNFTGKWMAAKSAGEMNFESPKFETLAPLEQFQFSTSTHSGAFPESTATASESYTAQQGTNVNTILPEPKRYSKSTPSSPTHTVDQSQLLVAASAVGQPVSFPFGPGFFSNIQASPIAIRTRASAVPTSTCPEARCSKPRATRKPRAREPKSTVLSVVPIIQKKERKPVIKRFKCLICIKEYATKFSAGVHVTKLHNIPTKPEAYSYVEKLEVPHSV